MIESWFTSAVIWITIGIYNIAAFVFKLFLILGTNRLVEDSAYSKIITNFYVIIGIIMLFVITFYLLKGMVNPDDQKTGATTIKKIVINLVTSAIIMSLLPMLFTFAYDFQSSFIINNVIGKFFNYGGKNIGDGSSRDPVMEVTQGANAIVNGVYNAFMYPSNGDVKIKSDSEFRLTYGTNESTSLLTECGEWTTGLYDSQSDPQFIFNPAYRTFEDTVTSVSCTGYFTHYLSWSKNIADDTVTFNWLLSIVAGALLIYVGVSYCFDMALRMIKLIFYQLIAPIPIFLRIIPEGKLSNTFNQWMKITLTCYLEIYVRIFIFYFVIFLCNAYMDSHIMSKISDTYGFMMGLLANAFILMGLVTFMRQAPKLFSDITGIDSGNMKLGIKDKLAAGGAFTAGAIIGGGVSALARNATNAGKNIRNRWNNDKKNGVSTRKRIGHVFSGIGHGALSTVGGAVSGAARSGKAGWNAKSGTDMKKAASSGATAAVEKRDKRASYKAAHSTGEGGLKGWAHDKLNVLGGHVKDTGTSIGGWMGINNVEDLKRENAAMEQIKQSRDDFDSIVDNLIATEMSKGKTSISTGSQELSFEKYKELQDYYNTAAIHGSVEYQGKTYTKAEMETLFNQEKKSLRLRMQNDLLINNRKWSKLNEDIRAKLAAARAAAVAFKGINRNNMNINAAGEVNYTGSEFADDKDFILGDVKREAFTFGGTQYSDWDFDSNSKEFTWKDSSGKSHTQILDDPKYAAFIRRINDSYSVDTVKKYDEFEKAMKRNTGENKIEITAQEHQKPDEKK